MTSRSTRREFIQQSAAVAAGVGYWTLGGVRAAEKARGPNDRINIACVGVGGKGSSDTDQAGQVGNVVALCDVDDNTLNRKAEKFPQARKYNDFRKMLEEMDKQIDAVTVSTPDHTHAPASVMAMRMGKHVYCQKPLTHTVYEARVMRETARKTGVCTQMGNQGTAENGLRRAVEVLQAGVIGPVREVHVWTNRPIWPQGAEAILKVKGAREAALAALHGKTLDKLPGTTPPKHVHWDLFLGPAPERPYDPIYHPFSWRGWWDYGTGALGDMACHTANMAFMALRLGYPTSVVAENDSVNPETYPMWAKVTFEFPARSDMPPVKFVWYEGQERGKRVLPPEKLLNRVLTRGQKLSDSGSLLVGDKGILFSPNDYGASYQFQPEKEFEGYKGPDPSLPRNGRGDGGMKAEWVEAIRNNKPALAVSNFEYAGLLTETILLGNVAMRAGKKLDWDGENFKFTNDSTANQFLHYEYRKGWAL